MALKRPTNFPLYLSGLNGPISFEHEAAQSTSQDFKLGSQDFNDALSKLAPLEALALFRTCLCRNITGGLSEWLDTAALDCFLKLADTKFSFLVFEGFNLLFMAISERWELKPAFILFISALFSNASFPQHYLQIYGSCCLSLLDPSQWAGDEAVEFRSMILQRCKLRAANVKGSQTGSYLEGFMVGFYPNQADFHFIDAFQVFSTRMETLGPHAFSELICEKILGLALDSIEAVKLGSAILLLPLLPAQEYTSPATLQLLWEEVILDHLYQLATQAHDQGFVLGRLAAKTLMIASSFPGFTHLVPVFKAAIQPILTLEVEDAYAALQSLWDPSSPVKSFAFLEPKMAYRDLTVNLSHLGFLDGLLNGTEVLPLFQNGLSSPSDKVELFSLNY